MATRKGALREERLILLLVDLPNIFRWAAERYDNPPNDGELMDALILQTRSFGPIKDVVAFPSSNLPGEILKEHLREARRRTPHLVVPPETDEDTKNTLVIPGVPVKVGEAESDPTDKAMVAFAALLLSADRVTTYVMATGDGDFTDLKNAVENNGKEFILLRPDLASTHPNLRERSVQIRLPNELDAVTLSRARAMLARLPDNLPLPETFQEDEKLSFLLAFIENAEIITHKKELSFRELSQHIWGYVKSEWGKRGLRLEHCEKMLDVLLNFTDLFSRREWRNASGKRVNIVYKSNGRSAFAALLRHPDLIA